MGSELQIKLDLNRTVAAQDSLSMSRVLLAFSKYDNTIGYVQGMNHIVDALMQHCCEEISFWLFVSLIEDY